MMNTYIYVYKHIYNIYYIYVNAKPKAGITLSFKIHEKEE